MRSYGSRLQRRKKSNLCPDYTRPATGKLAARQLAVLRRAVNANAVKHFEVPISEKSAYVDRFPRNRCAHDA